MTRRAKLQQLIDREPRDPFLHFGLAMEWLKEKNVDEALASFDRTIACDPNYTPAYYHKGNALISCGRLDEAREVLASGMTSARSAGDEHALGELESLLAGIV